jgi:WD40 repeat protein
MTAGSQEFNSPRTANTSPPWSNDSIRVFDSRNGDQLIAIETDIPSWGPITPLAWSNNGQQVFTASSDHKIKSFDVSTGSQLAKSQVPGDDAVVSIALAANGKFLATFADRSISFWDTSTLTQIGPVIEDSQGIRSIALSPDCSYLATGGWNGNITIRNLNNILPDPYGPFRVSIYACIISSDKSHILSSSLSHTDSFVLRTNSQRRVHLRRTSIAKAVIMTYSR